MNYEKFPFGKYKGHRLEDIPPSYLVYALKEFDLPIELMNSIKDTIIKDLGLEKIKDPFISTEININQVDYIYKKLAKKYHPDMGGNNETMKAINEFREELYSL